MININELIQTALSNGFEEVKEGATVFNRKCLLYHKNLHFYVRGDHSYDVVRVYLVVDEEENGAFLCYNPSIKYDIPCENEEYLALLEMAADYAGNVTDFNLYIHSEVVAEFGKKPLAADIQDVSDVLDTEIKWFERAIISFQTVIELMVDGYCKKDPL